MIGLLALWACNGEPPEPYAGPPEVQVASPTPPELPRFTCPPGWETVPAEGFDVCEPYPTGRQACADHEVHLPGTPGCVAVGPACPDGVWPDDLPGSGVWFVQEGAPSGTGTQSEPFGTLADALAVVAAGETVALSVGTHAGDVEVPDGVTLRGACAAQTQVVGATDLPALTAAGELVLRGLSVSSTTAIAVSGEGPEVAIRLEGVAVGPFVRFGATVSRSGRLSVHDSVFVGGVRDALGERGHAIYVLDDSELDVTATDIRGPAGLGMGGERAARVAGADVVVEGTGTLGFGTLETQEIQLSRIVAIGAGMNGVQLVRGAVALEDVVSLGSGPPQPSLAEGLGVVLAATRGTAVRVRAEDNSLGGIAIEYLADGEGRLESDVVLEDAMVRSTPRPGAYRFPVGMRAASTVEAHRVWMSSSGPALTTFGEGGSPSITDATLFLEPPLAGGEVPALELIMGSRVVIESSTVRALGRSTALLAVADAEVVLRDVQLAGTGSGVGVTAVPLEIIGPTAVFERNTVSLERVTLCDVGDPAFELAQTDASLMDVSMQTGSGAMGSLDREASLLVANSTFSNVAGAGWTVEDGALELAGVEISGVGGPGITVGTGGVVTMSETVVEDVRSAGVELLDGSAELAGVRISGVATEGPPAAGVRVSGSAVLQASRLAISDVAGPDVLQLGGTVSLE